MSRHHYDDAFYDYIDREAGASARTAIALLRAELALDSVVDFGCGRGAWLAAWQESGLLDVVGIDGEHVRRERLRIASECFVPHDLAQPLRLGRRFDLVQSLEVAEHLPASAADGFVDTLCAHGDLVLFAAAVPGQGGEQHVNEQPYDYWRERFARRGFVALDPLRPLLRGRADVAPWYRYNLLLYVRRERLAALAPRLQEARVADDRAIPDVSPLGYRARKALLRHLPVRAATWLARAKKHLAPGRAPLRQGG